MPQYWHEFVDTGRQLTRLVQLVGTCETIAGHCLDVQPGENVLIVTDTEVSPLIYHTLAGALAGRGGVPAIAIMQPLHTPGSEPPAAVAQAMLGADTIINLCSRSITHTAAAHRAYDGAGKRFLVMPAMTEEMLIRGSAKADWQRVKQIGMAFAGAANTCKGGDVHMTSELGTDLRFSVRGRDWLPYYSELRRPRRLEIFPAGEVNNCPLEADCHGTVVIDTFMMEVGPVQTPITWTVEGGRVVEIRGGAEADQLRRILETKGDENSYYIGEFAVGTNPWARFINSALEDKQVYGSIHIAIGTSVPHPANAHPRQAKLHLDGIVRKPTLTIDGRVLVDRGVIVDAPA